MKIKAIKKDIKSMKLSVPVDGIIEINENGVAEVSSKCGKMLIEGTNDWKEYKDVKKSDDIENDSEKVDEDLEESNSESEEHQPTDKEVIDGLNTLSLEDCIATAKAAGYPTKEWEKLSKNDRAAEKLMRQYLVKKYKASIK